MNRRAPWCALALLSACSARQLPRDAVSTPTPPRPTATPAPTAPPRPHAELIYFVMVDRFLDGDPSNNQASPGPAVDRADPQAWHGGDLRGVQAQLDHIQSLGVTKLWLSPVFTTRTTPIGEWGAFHGYWQLDPFTVEPRFGTEADLVALSQALQQRKMGLLLDLVTNHVGYDAPLLTEQPDWFHPPRTIEDWTDRTQLETFQVHGLPDLDQDNPQVAAWITAAARQWQDRLALDGYRVDAVRHVPNRFLNDLGATLREQDPDAWWLGEDFTGDVAELADSQRTGGFTHVFDFPLHYAMTEVFCDGAAPARLASVLSQDALYDRPQGLVTFLDNHDLPRIASRCDEDIWSVIRALTFMFATRGVPALTYGTEVGLPGAEEPLNRRDMIFGIEGLTPIIQLLVEHRRHNRAMQGGVQRVIHLDADSMAVARVDGDHAVIVGVNRGEAPVVLDIPPVLEAGVLMALLSQGGDTLLYSVTAPGGMDWETVAGYAPHDRPGREIPAHGVRVWRIQGQFPGWQALGEPRTVQVQVADAPDTARLVLVGAGPHLGNWDPAGGLALTRRGDGWSATLELPAGTVLEAKLVAVDADGSVTWSSADNQALLVPDVDSIWTPRW